MLKKLTSNKFVNYGFSILFGRGLEYLTFLFIALKLSKDDFGQFEYYKRLLEFGGIVFAFGAPVLIMTYTKNEVSKRYFYLISSLVSFALLTCLLPLFYWFNESRLILPLLFYVMYFYGNSITQSFNLVFFGSNYSSSYKMLVSTLYSSLMLVGVYVLDYNYNSILVASTVLFFIGCGYFAFVVRQFELERRAFLRYLRHYVKLIGSAFTLLADNLVNIAFMMTDIFLIKVLADATVQNKEIAEYSFALTIANALLVVPMTIFQVKIEAIKEDNSIVKGLRLKSIKMILLGGLCLCVAYPVVVYSVFHDYQNTIVLFGVILAAKVVQAHSVSFGVLVLVKKLYAKNFVVSVMSFLLNVLGGVVLYPEFGVKGIAVCSLLILSLRLIFIRKLVV